MEKETPRREGTSTSGLESVEEERIVGPVTLSTLSRELNNITALCCIQWTHQRQVTAEREHGSSSETVTCHGRTRRKKKDRKSE